MRPTLRPAFSALIFAPCYSQVVQVTEESCSKHKLDDKACAVCMEGLQVGVGDAGDLGAMTAKQCEPGRKRWFSTSVSRHPVVPHAPTCPGVPWTYASCSLLLSVPLCMPAQMGDGVINLPCKGKHWFHPGCVRPWLIKTNSCPTCREVRGMGGPVLDLFIEGCEQKFACSKWN